MTKRKKRRAKWKWIPELEEKYKASDSGKIKSYVLRKKGTILKLYHDKKHKSVMCTIQGKTEYVKFLISKTFVPKENSKQIHLVCFDYDKTNISADNLKWLTPIQYKHWKKKRPNKEKQISNSQLDGYKVSIIKRMIAEGILYSTISHLFCISTMQVSRIKKEENWPEIKIMPKEEFNNINIIQNYLNKIK